MRYLIPAACICALALSAPASAADYTLPSKQEKRTYSALWHAVRHQHGARVPGRNIRRWGIRTETGRVRVASAREVSRSIRTFRRWMAPPSPGVRPGDRISANPAYAGGRWAIPADIVMCESGGNYRAVNHGGSGAGGAYQIMPGTWAAHGGHGLPQDAPPAEQDRIAALIWNGGAGRGQWAC
jgi:Transglycosylase-like domain